MIYSNVANTVVSHVFNNFSFFPHETLQFSDIFWKHSALGRGFTLYPAWLATSLLADDLHDHIIHSINHNGWIHIFTLSQNQATL